MHPLVLKELPELLLSIRNYVKYGVGVRVLFNFYTFNKAPGDRMMMMKYVWIMLNCNEILVRDEVNQWM